MVNMNKEFNQSTDSLVRTTHARLSRLNSDNSKFGGRSQSLMEIGAGLPKRTLSSERKTPSPHSRSQSSSGIETPELPIGKVDLIVEFWNIEFDSKSAISIMGKFSIYLMNFLGSLKATLVTYFLLPLSLLHFYLYYMSLK